MHNINYQIYRRAPDTKPDHLRGGNRFDPVRGFIIHTIGNIGFFIWDFIRIGERHADFGKQAILGNIHDAAYLRSSARVEHIRNIQSLLCRSHTRHGCVPITSSLMVVLVMFNSIVALTELYLRCIAGWMVIHPDHACGYASKLDL